MFCMFNRGCCSRAGVVPGHRSHHRLSQVGTGTRPAPALSVLIRFEIIRIRIRVQVFAHADTVLNPVNFEDMKTERKKSHKF